jgi:hypothetical protein
VFDVDHDEERAASVGREVNGFSFEGMDAEGMDYALNRWVPPRKKVPERSKERNILKALTRLLLLLLLLPLWVC